MLKKIAELLAMLFSPKPPKPSDNHGVIVVEPTETDFIAGKFTGITYQVLNESGDWRPCLPTDEPQYKIKTGNGTWVGLETMACVSFSANNVIEMIVNHYTEKNLLPEETLDFLNDNGYFDENGKLNLSDRFLAKMSGTTYQGNSLTKVADTIRHYGIVPEKVWPWSDNITTWNQYYAAVPQSVIDLGKKSLEHFDFLYEWITSNFEEHLKQAPLQITIATTCPGYDAGNATACLNGVNHAVTRTAGKYEIYDHYTPFQKHLAANYSVPWTLKYVINLKKKMNNEVVLTINYKGKLGILLIGGLTGSIIFAKDWNHWLELCARYGANPNGPYNLDIK